MAGFHLPLIVPGSAGQPNGIRQNGSTFPGSLSASFRILMRSEIG